MLKSAIRVCLLFMHILHTHCYQLGEVEGTGSCTNVFNVWTPDPNFLQNIADLHAKIANVSQVYENKHLHLENKILDLRLWYQNISSNIDRQLLVSSHEDEKIRTDIEKIWRDLNQVHYIGDGSLPGHIRHHGNNNHDNQRALSELRNKVNNQKAEWLGIKREFKETKEKVEQLESVVENMGDDSMALKASIDELRNSAAVGMQSRPHLPNRVYPQDAEIVDDITELRARTNSLIQRMDKLEFTRASESSQKSTTPRSSVVTISLNGDYSNVGERSNHPIDCHDVYKHGMHTSAVYQIRPLMASRIDNVYCEMIDNSGWTLIQRRQDGSAQFNQEWREYKNGFGNLYGEFWIGNEMLHMLTSQKKYTLHIDMWDWDDQRFHAEYTNFHVASEDTNYRLTVGEFSGDAGDSLSSHSGHAFSTVDRDNDIASNHCAAEYKGGWWFAGCYDSNLNGRFSLGGDPDGIVWSSLKNTSLYSLKRSEMKIRPHVL